MLSLYINYWENKLLQEHGVFKKPLPFQLGENYLIPSGNKADLLKFIENINTDLFFSSDKKHISEFNLDKNNLLKFQSPFKSDFEINNICYADYYPASKNSAVIIIPHWNSSRAKYTKMCKFLQYIGYSSLCVSLPYHDERNPENVPISNYLLSSNIGRTIQSIRQAVLDTRAVIGWLINNNFSKIILIGMSIGTPVTMITAAHDSRVKGVVLCLTASDFAEAVWTGQSTQHIRTSFENNISLDELKKYWSIISPGTYVKKLLNKNQQHLIIYGKYDKTMFPYLTKELCAEYDKYNIKYNKLKLYCGHYTIKIFPFKYQLAWGVKRFLDKVQNINNKDRQD